MRPLSYYMGPKTLSHLRRVPLLPGFYRRSRSALIVTSNLLQKLAAGEIVISESINFEQKPLAWDLGCKEVGSVDELANHLEQNQIRFHEGKRALYVPPQQHLVRVLGDFVAAYPENSGFKISKQTFHSGSNCYNPEIELMLDVLGWGPKIFDLTELRTNELSMTCLVQEHISGTRPKADECRTFLQQIGQSLNNENPVAEHNIAEFSDNVIRSSEGKLYYCGSELISAIHNGHLKRSRLLNELDSEQVDFHFGSARFHREKRYLYQSVPRIKSGKRDTARRWSMFSRSLTELGITLDKRLVLDICCNSGMILAGTLSEGAFWGLGWDLPHVADAATRMQRVLGNTRLQITGAQLSPEYKISEDIPARLQPALDGAVVFFLAAWRYVGFMQNLSTIPWKALVYEGHQEDTPEEWHNNCSVMQKSWKCQLAFSKRMSDGDCGSRDVAIFIRP